MTNPPIFLGVGLGVLLGVWGKCGGGTWCFVVNKWRNVG
ncbi:DUF6132 family protein [Edaphobacter aggregans]